MWISLSVRIVQQGSTLSDLFMTVFNLLVDNLEWQNFIIVIYVLTENAFNGNHIGNSNLKPEMVTTQRVNDCD